jgi:hypothetical protein
MITVHIGQEVPVMLLLEADFQNGEADTAQKDKP